MVNLLSHRNSVLNHIIGEIRDSELQKDRLHFRLSLIHLGEMFAYEISKELDYEQREVMTPLGIASVPMLKEQPVLATILRAGIPFHEGFLNIFDKADSIFVSAYRKTHKDGSFTMQVEHFSVPEMDGKILILCDTMIATGSSMIQTYRSLMSKGAVKHTHIAAILGSVEGIETIRKHLPMKDVTIWTGVIDEELTAQAFIVPGLGDTGDLTYGKKI
jgi:uracil phosphoribosyltransferase